MFFIDMSFLYGSMKDSEVGHRIKTWLFVDGSQNGRGRFRNYFLLGIKRTTRFRNYKTH